MIWEEVERVPLASKASALLMSLWQSYTGFVVFAIAHFVLCFFFIAAPY